MFTSKLRRDFRGIFARGCEDGVVGNKFVYWGGGIFWGGAEGDGGVECWEGEGEVSGVRGVFGEKLSEVGIRSCWGVEGKEVVIEVRWAKKRDRSMCVSMLLALQRSFRSPCGSQAYSIR